MIRNYIISTVLVICVFMLSGCRLANMDDVNAMSSNNAIETTKQVQSEKNTDKWSEYIKYSEIPSDVEMPQLSDMDEEIEVKTGGSNIIKCNIEDAYITEDFKDILTFINGNDYENIYNFFTTKKKDEYIDDKANLCKSPMGIDRQLIIFKLKVTNDSDIEQQLASSTFSFYSIRYNQGGNMEYALIPSESRSCYFDEPDGWVEHKFNKVTLNPKESRELIMFCFADKYVVTRYLSHNNAQHKTVYDKVEADGLLLNNIYIGTNYASNIKTGRPEIWMNDKIFRISFK